MVDLIVSTSHCVAKAAGARKHSTLAMFIHLCVIRSVGALRHLRLYAAATPVRVAYSAGIVRQVSAGFEAIGELEFCSAKDQRVWNRESRWFIHR